CEADVAGAERHRRRLGRVEELRREQMLLQLRDRGLDRVDLRSSDENPVLQAGLDLLELTAEGRDAVVLDGKAERAVNGIQLVAARGDLLNGGGGGHLASSFVSDRSGERAAGFI